MTAAAAAQVPVPLLCGSRDEVAATLEARYGEVPVSVGLSNTGSVVEVFASPEGSWTIVATSPSGRSCLIAAGEAWQSLPPGASKDPKA